LKLPLSSVTELLLENVPYELEAREDWVEVSRALGNVDPLYLDVCGGSLLKSKNIIHLLCTFFDSSDQSRGLVMPRLKRVILDGVRFREFEDIHAGEPYYLVDGLESASILRQNPRAAQYPLQEIDVRCCRNMDRRDVVKLPSFLRVAWDGHVDFEGTLAGHLDWDSDEEENPAAEDAANSDEPWDEGKASSEEGSEDDLEN